MGGNLFCVRVRVFVFVLSCKYDDSVKYPTGCRTRLCSRRGLLDHSTRVMKGRKCFVAVSQSRSATAVVNQTGKEYGGSSRVLVHVAVV